MCVKTLKSCSFFSPEGEIWATLLPHLDDVMNEMTFTPCPRAPHCRKDTKTLYLRNRTLIPVGWRLSGLENLGDDFSVSQDSGIVEPDTEFVLQAHFRATKPIITNRKSIRLEVRLSTNESLLFGSVFIK